MEQISGLAVSGNSWTILGERQEKQNAPALPEFPYINNTSIYISFWWKIRPVFCTVNFNISTVKPNWCPLLWKPVMCGVGVSGNTNHGHQRLLPLPPISPTSPLPYRIPAFPSLPPRSIHLTFTALFSLLVLTISLELVPLLWENKDL